LDTLPFHILLIVHFDIVKLVYSVCPYIDFWHTGLSIYYYCLLILFLFILAVHILLLYILYVHILLLYILYCPYIVVGHNV